MSREPRGRWIALAVLLSIAMGIALWFAQQDSPRTPMRPPPPSADTPPAP